MLAHTSAPSRRARGSGTCRPTLLALAAVAAAAVLLGASRLPLANAQEDEATTGSCDDDAAPPYVGIDDATNQLVLDSGAGEHVNVLGKLRLDDGANP